MIFTRIIEPPPVHASTAADAATAGSHRAAAVRVRFAGIPTTTAAGAAPGNWSPGREHARGQIRFARPSLRELEDRNIRGHGSLPTIELAGHWDSHPRLGSDLTG